MRFEKLQGKQTQVCWKCQVDLIYCRPSSEAGCLADLWAHGTYLRPKGYERSSLHSETCQWFLQRFKTTPNSSLQGLESHQWMSLNLSVRMYVSRKRETGTAQRFYLARQVRFCLQMCAIPRCCVLLGLNVKCEHNNVYISPRKVALYPEPFDCLIHDIIQLIRLHICCGIISTFKKMPKAKKTIEHIQYF